MLQASGRHKPDFPHNRLQDCLGSLKGARATAWRVVSHINTSSHRTVLGAEFGGISWALMGFWRHTYYLRRLEEGHYDEFPDFAGLENDSVSLTWCCLWKFHWKRSQKHLPPQPRSQAKKQRCAQSPPFWLKAPGTFHRSIDPCCYVARYTCRVRCD